MSNVGADVNSGSAGDGPYFLDISDDLCGGELHLRLK